MATVKFASTARASLLLLLLLLLAGCISPVPRAQDGVTGASPVPQGPPAGPLDSPVDPGSRFACDNGLVLQMAFTRDSLTVKGLPQGPEVLLRDAGGVTPTQSVWSNDRLRAEIGLGAGGDEALLHMLHASPVRLRCRHSEPSAAAARVPVGAW